MRFFAVGVQVVVGVVAEEDLSGQHLMVESPGQ